MKKKVAIIILIISLVSIVAGFVIKTNTNSNDTEKTSTKQLNNDKIKSVNEALSLLNVTYLVDNPDQYYLLHTEDSTQYIFELVNSNDNKLYVVNKKTGEITISYRLQ